jgi:hypothetical protein
MTDVVQQMKPRKQDSLRYSRRAPSGLPMPHLRETLTDTPQQISLRAIEDGFIQTRNGVLLNLPNRYEEQFNGTQLGVL